MNRRSICSGLAATLIMSGAAWADIVRINDLTETPSVQLIANSSLIGSIANLSVVGETVNFTYMLPTGQVFGGNFNSFRMMLDCACEGDTAGAVSDTWRAVWSQGAATAAVSFSSDPATISLDGATQLPSITEDGTPQSVFAIGALSLDFQVASDVPEPATLLQCGCVLSAMAVLLYRRRRSQR